MDANIHLQTKIALDGFTNLNFPIEELYKLENNTKIVKYCKDDYFVKANERSNVISFIQKGLFRIFITDKDGKEVTKNFLGDGYFMGALTSLYSGKESLTNIQALEDSILVEIKYDYLLILAEQNPIWQKLLRIAAEKKYLEKEMRESELLLCDAKTRYCHFANSHPHWIDRIKQHYIASYLGMSAETLSRIKGKI